MRWQKGVGNQKGLHCFYGSLSHSSTAMRFREKTINTGGENSKFNEIVELIISPYSLVIEISKKFFFLPRDLIEKILLTTCIICLAQTVLSVLVRLYLGTFSLLEGKFPFVFQIGVLAVLVFLYIAYELADFSIYQNVDRLLPATDKVSSDEFEQEANDFLEEMLGSLDFDDVDNFELPKDSLDSAINLVGMENLGDFGDGHSIDIDDTVAVGDTVNTSTTDTEHAQLTLENASLFSGAMPAGPIPVAPTPVMPAPSVTPLAPVQSEEPVVEESVTEFSERYSNVVNKLASQMTYLGDISKAKLQQIKDNVELNASKQEFQINDILQKTASIELTIDAEETIDRLKDWVTPDYLSEALIGG